MTFVCFYKTVIDAHKGMTVMLNELRSNSDWSSVQVSPLDSRLITVMTAVRCSDPEIASEFINRVMEKMRGENISVTRVMWVGGR